MTEPIAKPYFQNLDALRFIAAAAVICAHCWMHIDTLVLKASWIGVFRHYAELGVLGVNFFFVISGFLITYLMLNEKSTTGTFKIRRYFMRRILRIWPLFYLILAIGFVIIPAFKIYILHQPYFESAKPLWYIFFISNFHDLIYGQPYSPALASLWTIAIEEQFYVFFPLILLLPKKSKIIYPILIIIISVLFRSLVISDSKQLYMHTFSVMGDFGVGGVLAFFCYYKPRFYYVLANMPKLSIALMYALLIFCLAFDYTLFKTPEALVFERIILAILFSAVIFEQVFCENSFIKLGKSLLISYGGKISYGMYCYQYFAIVPVYSLMTYYHMYNLTPGFLFLHPLLSLIIAYLLATLSYKFYESYFLKLKTRFYPA